ncbi:hypothetical protein EMIT0P100_30052 [Pseudomonas sp. IT-P100]
MVQLKYHTAPFCRTRLYANPSVPITVRLPPMQKSIGREPGIAGTKPVPVVTPENLANEPMARHPNS